MKGQGHAAMGSYDRSSHEQHINVHKAHDHEAGRLRTSGATVSGAKLVKRDKATPQNDALFEVEVKGPSVLVRWGKAERASDLKHEVKTFPDALLAERWAADTVTEKLKAGFEVDESDQAGRQEGVPRIPSGVE